MYGRYSGRLVVYGSMVVDRYRHVTLRVTSATSALHRSHQSIDPSIGTVPVLVHLYSTHRINTRSLLSFSISANNGSRDDDTMMYAMMQCDDAMTD